MALNLDAPTRHHNPASSLMSCTTLTTLGEEPSNTQLFLCFQIHHTPRATIELKPFLLAPGTLLSKNRHQSWKPLSSRPSDRCCKPTLDWIWTQTSLANTQDTKRCYTISSSWSHKGHFSGCSNPCRASQSAVQHRFRAANQRENLHFGSAQVLQMRSAGSKANQRKNLHYSCTLVLALTKSYAHNYIIMLMPIWLNHKHIRTSAGTHIILR
jgi:hypothetical protein